MIEVFIPSTLYDPKSEEMRCVFGSHQRLTQWRCKGRGPAYIKIGKSVFYKGEDLNKYLWQNRVVTEDARSIEAKKMADKVRAKQKDFGFEIGATLTT